MTNYLGENNCFLNVTIQALWHLGPFRVELLKLIKNNQINTKTKYDIEKLNGVNKDHIRIVSNNNSNFLDALCNLFVQYEFTKLATLPATELRGTLSTLSDQFQLGEFVYMCVCKEKVGGWRVCGCGCK